jgi:hypothetical protein
MDPDLTRKAALLWKRILLEDPTQIFGAESTRLLQRNWGDRIAQPGYVGRLYSVRGLTFVSMNPGGGPSQGLGPEDLAQYEVLQKLRDSTEAEAPSAFLELTAVLERIMPTWKIFRNFVSPVLEHAKVDFSHVAYLNLLKWRTKSSSGLARLYDLSWRDHTQDQFALLQPSLVIAIGSDAGNAFRRHYPSDVHFDSIPRVIGNNIGPEGRAALERIKEWLQHHPLAAA